MTVQRCSAATNCHSLLDITTWWAQYTSCSPSRWVNSCPSCPLCSHATVHSYRYRGMHSQRLTDRETDRQTDRERETDRCKSRTLVNRVGIFVITCFTFWRQRLCLWQTASASASSSPSSSPPSLPSAAALQMTWTLQWISWVWLCYN